LHIVEPLEGDRDRVGPRAPSRSSLGKLRPGGTDDDQRSAPVATEHLLDDIEQRIAGPVHVLEHDHHHLGEAHRPDQPGEGPCNIRGGGRPRRRQAGGNGRGIGLAGHQLENGLGKVSAGRGGCRGDLEQGFERGRREHRPAVADEEGEVGAQARHLRDEPRLADPGLSQHGHQVRPVRLAGPRQCPAQGVELGLAAHHRKIEPAPVSARRGIDVA